MPVLKIKNNGVWEQVSGIPNHTHIVDDITDFPTSLPANGGNADTVDGKHASDFASAAEMTTVQNDINDINTMLNGIDIPTALPNPNTLTFTGAVEGTYDGSSPVTVNIPSVLVVRMLNNNGTWSADKTYKEIKEAFLNGTAIYALTPDGYQYPLSFIDEVNAFRFEQTNTDGFLIIDEFFDVSEDNYISHYYQEIDKLPNPKAITFTGAVNTSYDGSSEMSVEIPDVSGKMDKNNPTGTGSFSLNRKSGTTIGKYSHAEGLNTTASGAYSHAEGERTVASAAYSHAEGGSTKALNNFAHAEGSSTTASGFNSHAEGNFTTASGQGSHAEGSSTQAASIFQHVQGKYNIVDSSNVYADIIGNGRDGSPSNAATVDWSGNAWYAGDVYVGSTSGTNKDEGSKKLATEEYVDNSVIVPAPSSADNGKYLGCADGKAAWLPVEASGGGSDKWETICEIVGFDEDLHMYEVNGANGPVYKKIYLYVSGEGTNNTVFAFCGRGNVLPDIYSGTNAIISAFSILSIAKNPTAFSARIEKDDIGVYTQISMSSGVGSAGNATPTFEPIGYGIPDDGFNRFRNVYKLGGIQNIRIYQRDNSALPTGIRCRIMGVRV